MVIEKLVVSTTCVDLFCDAASNRNVGNMNFVVCVLLEMVIYGLIDIIVIVCLVAHIVPESQFG
jgi:hypothetical protein